jgi:hypothetical protein
MYISNYAVKTSGLGIQREVHNQTYFTAYLQELLLQF